jgi:hypothetical protein
VKVLGKVAIYLFIDNLYGLNKQPRVEKVLEFCQCFLHRQITGWSRSHVSSSEVVSQTTSTQ